MLGANSTARSLLLLGPHARVNQSKTPMEFLIDECFGGQAIAGKDLDDSEPDRHERSLLGGCGAPDPVDAVGDKCAAFREGLAAEQIDVAHEIRSAAAPAEGSSSDRRHWNDFDLNSGRVIFGYSGQGREEKSAKAHRQFAAVIVFAHETDFHDSPPKMKRGRSVEPYGMLEVLDVLFC
jgi:hypothetical protein